MDPECDQTGPDKQSSESLLVETKPAHFLLEQRVSPGGVRRTTKRHQRDHPMIGRQDRIEKVWGWLDNTKSVDILAI